MKEGLKLTFAVAVICVIAGLVLGSLNAFTAGPIAEAKREAGKKALDAVLPEHDNSPVEDKISVSSGETGKIVYPAFLKGRYAGAAFETSSKNGYAGLIRIMVGVTSSNTVNRISVTEQRETPGLGSRAADMEFVSQFQGGRLDDLSWCRVRKDDPDKGAIDAVTGATISSRAVAEAVEKGLRFFRENRRIIIEEIDKDAEK